jgi:hypothetical protein
VNGESSAVTQNSEKEGVSVFLESIIGINGKVCRYDEEPGAALDLLSQEVGQETAVGVVPDRCPGAFKETIRA